MRRRMVLSGRIDNPYTGGRLDRKGIRIFISSPPDPEWEEMLKTLDHVKNACGFAKINSRLGPENVEINDTPVEEEPVAVKVNVGHEAFEAMRRQALEAHERRRVLRADITLVGESLPDRDSPRAYPLAPNELDVAEKIECAVESFGIAETLHTDRWRGRLLLPELASHERHGISISMLLTESRYDIDASSGQFHPIACEGRVINKYGKSYHQAPATIEFVEHEADPVVGEHALAGEFGTSPHAPTTDTPPPHISGLGLSTCLRTSRNSCSPFWATLRIARSSCRSAS